MSDVGTRFTYRDYLLLPEGKRYEILGGDLVAVPSPGVDHQRVSGRAGPRRGGLVRLINAAALCW